VEHPGPDAIKAGIIDFASGVGKRDFAISASRRGRRISGMPGYISGFQDFSFVLIFMLDRENLSRGTNAIFPGAVRSG